MPERKKSAADEGPTQLRFPELVDIKTVARLLGVNERCVRRMVADGRVEVVKLGLLVRFDLDHIRDYVEGLRRAPATAS